MIISPGFGTTVTALTDGTLDRPESTTDIDDEFGRGDGTLTILYLCVRLPPLTLGSISISAIAWQSHDPQAFWYMPHGVHVPSALWSSAASRQCEPPLPLYEPPDLDAHSHS